MYVEECSAHQKEFETELEVFEFIQKFQKKHKTLDDHNDNYINQIFYGKKLMDLIG
jgi:hypothetical protein